MNKKRYLKTRFCSYFVSVAIVASLYSLISFPFGCPQKKHPIAETRMRLEHIVVGVLFLPQSDIEYMVSYCDSTNGNTILSELFAKYPGDSRFSAASYDLEKGDVWGNPFNIRIDATDCVEGNNFLFVVWSSGANGINENGDGDDIMMEGFIQRKPHGGRLGGEI